MEKLKGFIQDNWMYILAFFIPGIVVALYCAVNGLGIFGNGSLLRGDTGELYVPCFYELWDKVHCGEALFYTWHACGGVDFYQNAAFVVFSPFTLIILALPRAWVANGVEIIMVLKWSLTSLSMVYFFYHTHYNTLKAHKRLVSLFLGLAWGLSNGMINFMGYLNWTDAMILFPILLLLVEKLVLTKKWKLYYIILTLCMVFNFYMSYHIGLFLALWFFMQLEKETLEKMKKFLIFAGSSALSALSGMFVILPCLMAQSLRNSVDSLVKQKEYAESVLNSVHKVIESFFICDAISGPFDSYPNVYFSIAGVVLVLLFVFCKIGKKKKIYIIAVFGFMTASLFYGYLNLIWHGFTRPQGIYNRFINAYIFLLLFMALQTLVYLDEIALRDIVGIFVLGLAAIIGTIVRLEEYQDFQVYLLTIVLYVTYVLLIMLYKKGNIVYSQLLKMIAIFSILELMVSGYNTLSTYSSESFLNDQRQQVLTLTENLKIADGERVIFPSWDPDCGMAAAQATDSGFHSYSNGRYIHFNKQLGMIYTDRVRTSCNGASPLINLIFNARYAVEQNDYVVSDAKKEKKLKDYSLYRIKRLAGLGYMVDDAIQQWNIDEDNFFEVQNSFVRQAVGGKEIFTPVSPRPVCESEGVALESDTDQENQGVYLYHIKKKTDETGFISTIRYTIPEDMDLYMAVKSNLSLGGCLLIDGEEKCESTEVSTQRTIHIGKVKKGQKITYTIQNFSDKSHADVMLECQFAKFNEEVYAGIYNKLSSNVLKIEKMEADKILGSISVDKPGIMMTSIQASDGFTLLVDGKKTEYSVIGGCMMGVPLESGHHTIELSYRTPYVTEGIILTIIGGIIFYGCCYFKFKKIHY